MMPPRLTYLALIWMLMALPIILASELPDKGAMTSLNLSENGICKYGKMDGIKAIASALKVNAVILILVICPSDQ
jgi:hypothetical protein